MTHVTCENGRGMFYAGDYGAIQRHDIPAGKVFCVDSGLFFACSDRVSYDIGLVCFPFSIRLLLLIDVSVTILLYILSYPTG